MSIANLDCCQLTPRPHPPEGGWATGASGQHLTELSKYKCQAAGRPDLQIRSINSL
jgi:hypothetical protein